MARNDLLKCLRTTRANLVAQAAASGLVAGEPYLITDEARLAVATAVNAFQAMAKQNEYPSIVVTDADTISNPGFYLIPAGAGNHAPDASSWDLLHSGNQTNNYTQMAFKLSVSEPSIYVRSKTAGSWGTWRPLTPEYGSNSNGSWIKYPNGVMECWGTVASRSVNINTGGTGSGVFFSAQQTITFPQTFVSAPQFQVFSNLGNLMWTAGDGAPTTTGAAYRLIAASTETARTSSETWSAKGRWF